MPPTPAFCVTQRKKIPTCWYLLRWVPQIFRVLPDAKPKICVGPDANPRRQSVEYRWRWVPGVGSLRWACTFHVFVLISFASGSQREPLFRWNMGFNQKKWSRNDKTVALKLLSSCVVALSLSFILVAC